MDRIKLHLKIEEISQQGPAAADIAIVIELLADSDRKSYFFTIIDQRWFDWLLSNGFLESIKQKAETPDRYSYTTPEISYLERVVQSIPEKVTDFILSVPISAETFNPEVIDRFLRICSTLPVEQAARIIPKIRDEGWVKLMAKFNGFGFEYQRLFEKLVEAKDWESILILAEAVLAIRSKAELEFSAFGSLENAFYFNNITEVGVLDALAAVPDEQAEQALKIVTKALKEIALLGDPASEKPFALNDTTYVFYNVDFFNLSFEGGRHNFDRESLKELAALFKTFTARLIGPACDKDSEQAKDIYEKYVNSLPDSRAMWRLKLSILGICPKIFLPELRDALFRIFDIENLWQIAGGAEYEQALKVGYPVLQGDDQIAYKKKIFEKLDTAEGNRPARSIYFGILSCIFEYLSAAEKQKSEEVFGQSLEKDYQPKPDIGEVRSGFVSPQAPPNAGQEWSKSVDHIVELLKTEWTPKLLVEKNRKGEFPHDFLKPVNAEGVSSQLNNEIKKRLAEYVSNAELFFDRERLDAQYTYTYLRAIEDALRSESPSKNDINWEEAIALGSAIVKSGVEKPFDTNARDRAEYDSWLASWTSVHSILADVMKELLQDREGEHLFDFSVSRKALLEILKQLLAYEDPKPADEVIDTAKIKTKPSGEIEYQVTEPFSLAINSVRGRAFQAFLQFVYQDGKKYPEGAISKLDDDVKQLYEQVLDNEGTMAIMFMFGHYLAFFHYRDRPWSEGLYPKIFSSDPTKKDLYLAAWEGYLTSNLFSELFESLNQEYERAIKLNPDEYTKRRYTEELDVALANHLALAYVHFTDFDLNSPLFKLFWSTPNSKRHGAFISFVGRHVVGRDQQEKWFYEAQEVITNKVKAFWEWALESSVQKEALIEFGYWMRAGSEVFKSDQVWLAEMIERTMSATNGDADGDTGLTDSLTVLVDVAPEKVLKILRSYLISEAQRQPWVYMRMAEGLEEILKKTYQQASTKDETYRLINDLLPLGNGRFWKLTEVLK